MIGLLLHGCVGHRPPERPPELGAWKDLEWVPATRWQNERKTGWTFQVSREFVVDFTSESAVAACDAEIAKGSPGCTFGYGCASVSYLPPRIWMVVDTGCVHGLPEHLIVQKYADVGVHPIRIERLGPNGVETGPVPASWTPASREVSTVLGPVLHGCAAEAYARGELDAWHVSVWVDDGAVAQVQVLPTDRTPFEACARAGLVGSALPAPPSGPWHFPIVRTPTP